MFLVLWQVPARSLFVILKSGMYVFLAISTLQYQYAYDAWYIWFNSSLS